MFEPGKIGLMRAMPTLQVLAFPLMVDTNEGLTTSNHDYDWMFDLTLLTLVAYLLVLMNFSMNFTFREMLCELNCKFYTFRLPRNIKEYQQNINSRIKQQLV